MRPHRSSSITRASTPQRPASAIKLVIQNDLGTTDAHVIVIHCHGVGGCRLFIQTSIGLRLQFFRGLFDGRGVDWIGRTAVAASGYESCVGRRTSAQRLKTCRNCLRSVGSRLVFLIDWNRARKCLSRFLKKSNAVIALRWAADHGYGHRAFLEAGGERLIYSALERTAPAHLRYGARLDEVLGSAGGPGVCARHPSDHQRGAAAAPIAAART